MYGYDIGMSPVVLAEPKPTNECDKYFAKDLRKKIVISTASFIVPGHLVSMNDR